MLFQHFNTEFGKSLEKIQPSTLSHKTKKRSFITYHLRNM